MSFKDEMVNDMDVFLNTDEFAREVIYLGTFINVQLVEAYDENGKAFYTQMFCRASDIPDISDDSTFQIGGVAYGVVDFNIDDFNISADIYLNKVLI